MNNHNNIQRYYNLWDASTEAAHGPVIPTIEQSHIPGSRMYEINSLVATDVSGTLIRVTNGEVVFAADQQAVAEKLSTLEDITAQGQ